MRKSFQELDLCNSFLFAVALEDPETCRLILEIILGQSVPDVVVHTEHNIFNPLLGIHGAKYRCVCSRGAGGFHKTNPQEGAGNQELAQDGGEVYDVRRINAGPGKKKSGRRKS